MTRAYSGGWDSAVELGAGQERMRLELLRSIRHPSRSWHDAPTMRAYGRAPATAHRLMHRLHALGVIAIQTTLGAYGGVRFTFGVRYWRKWSVRRGQLARMRTPAPAPAPGQMELRLMAGESRRLEELHGIAPPPPAGPFGALMARAGFVPWWRS